VRQVVYTLFLTFFVLASNAQQKRIPLLTPKGDLNCRYIKKYSEQKRLQFYPFNISDTIKLVSFRYHKNKSPINKDSLVTDSLLEIKTLGPYEIIKLTDILYNNFYKQSPNYGVSALCYLPRNAILFYKGGKLKEFVEICFHCHNYELSSKEISMGDECTQKMEKLMKLFASSGIKFGTDNTIESYPGEVLGDEGIPAPPK
jgi:hypothetical protein